MLATIRQAIRRANDNGRQALSICGIARGLRYWRWRRKILRRAYLVSVDSEMGTGTEACE